MLDGFSAPKNPLNAGSNLDTSDTPPGRPVDDPSAVRKAIFDKSLQTLQEYKPIAGTTHTLRIENPSYEGPEDFSEQAQKDAIINNLTLGRRLRADVILSDNATGTDLAKKRVTLANIPYYTDRGTIINRGTAYTMANQMRLQPGSYTRVKESGELENHVNPTPGNGVPHRIFLDPKSGVFRIRIGQANIPLVPLLHAMGVDDQQIKRAWGSDLAAINFSKTTSGDLTKLYKRLVWHPTETDPHKQREAINIAMQGTQLDPDVMQRTLGKPYANVSSDMLLDITRKLLAVKNKHNPALLQRLGLNPADEDDRDHLAFMRLLGPEDIIAERLRSGSQVLRAALWKAVRTKNLDNFPTNILNKSVRSALLESGLAQASEEINPVQILEQRMRVTRMGMGAIPSTDAIPESSRAVQSSHLNFIDPVSTPECFDSGTQVYTAQGWLNWKEVTQDTKFLCRDADGTLFYSPASKIIKQRYVGRMYGYESETINYLVTPNHMFFVRDPETKKWIRKAASEIHENEYGFPTGECADTIVTAYPYRERHYRGYYTAYFAGMVYCATVPGGMLYVRRKDKELWTGNSSRIGVDVRFAQHVRKGPNGEMWAPFKNTQTGAVEWKQPKELYDAKIAFPGYLPKPGEPIDQRALSHALQTNKLFESDGKLFIPAIHNGQMDIVPINEVDYQLPHMEKVFTPTMNLVPLKSGMKAHRSAMAARMITQALPLADAEAPYVQNGTPDDPNVSYEDQYGVHVGAVRAQKPGIVTDVQPNSITVQHYDGTTSNIGLSVDRPSNRKTGFTQTPVVQPGDIVANNSLLAHSNYTDKNGTVALGKNVRAAYIPVRGYNYEDAQVISESLAKRLTSLHMYQHPVDLDPTKDKADLKTFRSIFPNKYSDAQLSTIDDNGVIKVGSKVNYGDPLMLVATPRSDRVGELSHARSTGWKDQSETWDHHTEGIVTDVSRTNKGMVVAVKTLMPTQLGDKLAPRNGSKGVISAILPDDQMPIAEDGKPIEWAINPNSIITRSNPAQIPETLLGKIAAITGKPYKIQDFGDIDDLNEFANNELKKHGLHATETVTDPVTGRQIPGVLVGNSYIMKLHHTAEAKASGRGFGAYTADHAPAKGGPEGSKTWGMLHLNALLSSGATGAIVDGSLVRGQQNPDYWAAVMSGRTPPDPPVPFVYKKFITQLQGAGINPVRTGSRTQLMAMTSDDINDLAGNREVQNPNTINWDDANMTPIKGGLFDEGLFGGAAGNRWAKITLAEALPNPVMEEPIRRLLGLTKQQFNDVIANKDKLNGRTGPAAIVHALKNYNVDNALKQAEYQIRYGRKTQRDDAVRRIGYLLGIKRTGVTPDKWVWNAVPVMPPIFRPVNKMQGSGVPMVADANYLYRDLFENNQNLKENAKEFDNVGDERLALYNSLKALTGLTDPAPQHLQERNVKGILKHITGNSPKYSIVQRRLLGSTADLVGRATIIPNPDLDLDSVSLPEEQAWKVYKPFIVRKLAQSGMPVVRAAQDVQDRSAAAKNALLDVMRERPVIIDRAPVLHRYSVMAFWPRLTKNSNMELNPSINKGFNADYDGDAMQFHVPSTDDAIHDAVTKLMPSKNLLAVSNFKVHQVPQQEYLAGLYHASTKNHNNMPIQFQTKAEAIKAFKQGKLDLGHTIQILEKDA